MLYSILTFLSDASGLTFLDLHKFCLTRFVWNLGVCSVPFQVQIVISFQGNAQEPITNE